MIKQSLKWIELQNDKDDIEAYLNTDRYFSGPHEIFHVYNSEDCWMISHKNGCIRFYITSPLFRKELKTIFSKMDEDWVNEYFENISNIWPGYFLNVKVDMNYLFQKIFGGGGRI